MRSPLKLAVLRIARALGFFRLARWLTRRRLRILCYHGIAVSDEARFRPGLFMSADNFRRRLDCIARHAFPVIGLGEGVDKLRRGEIPGAAVVLTFDDGFANLTADATRELQRRGLPTTLYLTSYYMVHNKPIFRLAIAYMIWKSPREAIRFEEQSFDLRQPEQREALTWELIRRGEAGDEDLRDALCRQLAELCEVDYQAIVDRRLLSLLSPEEARELAEQGFDIQLHTHRHRFPDDDEDAARREIRENRAVLEPLGSAPLEHFCYPSGEWKPRQSPWLEELGVLSATTCDPGLNRATDHPLQLKRFVDDDTITLLEFEAELFGFAEILRALRRLLRPAKPQGA